MIVLLPFLFLFAQILSERVTTGTGRIVLIFGDMVDMVDMDVNLCKRVSKFKMLGLKSWPTREPKTAKICTDYFPLTTEGIVLNFFYTINIDI